MIKEEKARTALISKNLQESTPKATSARNSDVRSRQELANHAVFRTQLL